MPLTSYVEYLQRQLRGGSGLESDQVIWAECTLD